MKSKITAIQPNGTWENSNGVDLGNGKMGFFKFDYTFEDGITLTVNSKSNPPTFKIGDVAEYEVKNDNSYGKSGTVKKPQEQFNGGSKGGFVDNTPSIVLQVCAKIASDQYCNRGEFGTPEDIFTYADELARKMLEGTKALK